MFGVQKRFVYGGRGRPTYNSEIKKSSLFQGFSRDRRRCRSLFKIPDKAFTFLNHFSLYDADPDKKERKTCFLRPKTLFSESFRVLTDRTTSAPGPRVLKKVHSTARDYFKSAVTASRSNPASAIFSLFFVLSWIRM